MPTGDQSNNVVSFRDVYQEDPKGPLLEWIEEMAIPGLSAEELEGFIRTVSEYSTIVAHAVAGEQLFAALKEAETGRNSLGPTWNTAKLMAALLTFYAEMGDQ